MIIKSFMDPGPGAMFPPGVLTLDEMREAEGLPPLPTKGSPMSRVLARIRSAWSAAKRRVARALLALAGVEVQASEFVVKVSADLEQFKASLAEAEALLAKFHAAAAVAADPTKPFVLSLTPRQLDVPHRPA